MFNFNFFKSGSDSPVEQQSRDELLRAIQMLENVNRAQATTIGLQEDRITHLEARNQDLTTTLRRTEEELNRASSSSSGSQNPTTSPSQSRTGPTARPVVVKSEPATSTTPLSPPISRPVQGPGNSIPTPHASRASIASTVPNSSASSAPPNNISHLSAVQPQRVTSTPSASLSAPLSRRLRRQYVCPVGPGRRLVREPAFYEPWDDPTALEVLAGVRPTDPEVVRFEKMLNYESDRVQRASACAGGKRCRAQVDDDDSAGVRDDHQSGIASSSQNPSGGAPSLGPSTSAPRASEDLDSNQSSKKRRLSPQENKVASTSLATSSGRHSDAKRRRMH